MIKGIMVALLAFAPTFAMAEFKCEQTPSGKLCCWETKIEGQMRPIWCEK